MRFLMTNRWRRVAIGVLLLAVVVMGGTWIWLQRQLSIASQAVSDRKWPEARQSLVNYLRVRPGNDNARLMLAEAFIRDNKYEGDDQLTAALGHLGRIPDTSPRAAEARLQEGRIYLLLMMMPWRAEKAFRRSLDLDGDRLETHMLLWRLYNLTDRWDLAEPHVWELCVDQPQIARADRLRDWYLSEFSPGTANMELDLRLGLLADHESPSESVDRRRLESFIASEPDWIDGHALLARWFHRQGGLQQAATELDAAEALPGGPESPLVIATRVEVCLELGDFDRAKQAFEKWTAPKRGYEYWKTAGLVADQITRDNAQAVEAFGQAVQTTAGKSDWLTQHRLAQCLTRLGKSEQAAAMRQHSKQVELLMETPVHTALRRALMTPLDPASVAKMVELYEQLGREREVAAWKELLAKPATAG